MRSHTSYVICATPRSGSSLLCEVLRNTGVAGRPDEYLDTEAVSELAAGKVPPLPGYVWYDWRDNPPSWSTRAGIADILARVIERGTTPNGVFGAKVMWDHFAGFIDTLQQLPEYQHLPAANLMSTLFPNLSYIWMTRRDKVRQAVSFWRAIETNHWAWFEGQPPIPVVEPSFDYNAIAFLYRLITAGEEAWQQYFAECGITPLVVVYEDLVQADEAIVRDVLRYIGLPVPDDLAVGPRHLKKQADALSEEWVQLYYSMGEHAGMPSD